MIGLPFCSRRRRRQGATAIHRFRTEADSTRANDGGSMGDCHVGRDEVAIVDQPAPIAVNSRSQQRNSSKGKPARLASNCLSAKSGR